MARSRTPLQERFWPKVDMTGEHWLWQAAVDKNGYGWFKVTREPGHAKQEKAHRVCWELVFGPVPDGEHVLHRCDTPMCVRPSHLFTGSELVNRHDAIKKGRWQAAKGERVHGARLTEEIVLEIRRRYALGNTFQRELADEFGVGQSHISSIVTRRIWRHI